VFQKRPDRLNLSGFTNPQEFKNAQEQTGLNAGELTNEMYEQIRKMIDS
jgi:hypothetical protein